MNRREFPVAALILVAGLVIAVAFGGAFYLYTMARIKAVEPPPFESGPVGRLTPAEMRKNKVDVEMRRNIEENNAIVKKIEYIRKRAEVGEILQVQAEDEERPLKRRIEELADDRKRYEVELYEIDAGNWKPR